MLACVIGAAASVVTGGTGMRSSPFSRIDLIEPNVVAPMALPHRAAASTRSGP
jgi:hypothetical protein